MRNIIALCNTYAQLIAVIQMKMTIFSKDKVSLILSDHSRNAKEVVDRISKTEVFENTLFLETKWIEDTAGMTSDSFALVKKGIEGTYDVENDNINQDKFDVFLYYNYGISANLIYSKLYRTNPKIECAIFEEGIASYDDVDFLLSEDAMSKKMLLIQRMRSILKKKNLNDSTELFYCYYPEFYKGKLQTVRIPLIKNEQVEMKKVLKYIFDLSDENLSYGQKYIFFAGAGNAENGELEIAKKLAKLVGRENLLIKVHPRDTSRAFEKSGLLVDYNSSKPWEAIQLSNDFSNHVFLSVYSGALLAVNLMLENVPRSFYLFNLTSIEGNAVGEEMVKRIKKIKKMGKEKLDNVSIVESSLDEIINTELME